MNKTPHNDTSPEISHNAVVFIPENVNAIVICGIDNIMVQCAMS